jgi:excisionase family DNA binding protein
MTNTHEARPMNIAAEPTDCILTPIARLLLTPREAAASLRISARLLWTLTKSGEISCIRIGKAVRYSPADLQLWITERKARS